MKMSISQRFKTGINISFKSFSILWNNKATMFFLLLLQSALFLLPILLAWIPKIRRPLLLALSAPVFFMTLYLEVVIMYLAVQFAKDNKLGVLDGIRSCKEKAGPVVVFLLMSSIIFFIVGWYLSPEHLFLYLQKYSPIAPPSQGMMITKEQGSFALFFSFKIIVGLIALLFLFVLPAIAVDKKSLLQNVKDAPIILFKLFWQLIGSATIIFVAFYTFFIGSTATTFLLNMLFPIAKIISIPIFLLLMPIGKTILTTAGTMNLALLYQHYKEQKTF